jgi:hypothetical protein
MAPRKAVPLREIVYMLSPYEQNIFMNMFKNWPHTVADFVKEVRRPAPRPAPAPAPASPRTLTADAPPSPPQKAAGILLAGGILYGSME